MSRIPCTRTLFALAALLLGACGTPDAAQTSETTPTAYPYAILATEQAGSTIVATPTPSQSEPNATTEASATPFYTPVPSNTPDVPRSPTPTIDVMTLIDMGRPLSQIERIAFASAEHGWLFGHACAPEGSACTPEFDTTTDGGQVWRRLPTPVIRRLNGSMLLPNNVSQLLFSTTSDGWLVSQESVRQGADIQTRNIIGATHDGGQSWHEDEHSGRASILGYKNGTLWLVQGDFVEQPTSHFDLLRSSNGGATWQASQITLPSVRARFDYRLLQANGTHAWLIGPFDTLATYDGGQSWVPAKTPCQDYSRLVPLNRRRWWRLCVGNPGTQMQEKQLYQSHDAGQSWQLVAKSQSFVDGSCDAVCSLPLGGYAGQFVMVSATTGFIAYGQNGLSMTRDGGQTWNSAIPYECFKIRITSTTCCSSTPTTSGWQPTLASTAPPTVAPPGSARPRHNSGHNPRPSALVRVQTRIGNFIARAIIRVHPRSSASKKQA